MRNWKCILAVSMIAMSMGAGAYAQSRSIDDFRRAISKEDEVRTNQMDFEDGLVEGMGKSKGNFASLATKRKKKPRSHLYSRMIDWDRVMHQKVREMRYHYE